MSANDDFSLHDDEELSLHDDASLAGSDDYRTWAMEMEHYLEYIDNEVWKVIQNGNSKKRVTKGKDGVYRILPPTTQAEQVADEKERKARTLLLMAVPKDHSRRFHGMDDAKEIWAAIKTRFGGNANSKKMQKAVLKQQFEAFTISSKESLEKGYDSYDNETKEEFDTLSIMIYNNNLMCLEQDIQKTSSSSLTSDNVAFLSQAKASSSKHKPSHNSGSYSSTTTSSPKPNQIDDLDLERWDINWQIAYDWAIKIKKFYKKTVEGHRVDGKMHVEFDREKWETDPGYHDIPLFSRFKQVEYKGVPPPLSGDYTPRAQEDIDDSLYVYGKHGPQPQSPSPTETNASSIVFSICPFNDSDGELGTVSNANSTVYSTCQSNDSDGEQGTVSDHSVNDDSIPVPSSEQVSISTQKTQPQVPKPQPTVDPSSKGSISGKGTIRLGNLVFDDVAFVKELGHFNLFSISQICDKKLNVLFTEKECFVVSSDFKMPDENQVLLKVPRQHNMYTFDMKNVDSSQGYTCLLAKASSNEAKLWHRRVKLDFCGEKGIKQEFSNARTPQQNGVAERMNRTLIEAARTMLADSLLPTTFWAEASKLLAITFNRTLGKLIPISLQNQANHAGSKEVSDIDVQTEEAEELLVVSSTSRPAAVSEHNATKKSLSSKKPSSTPISKSADDIMVFRKELDALALKHLGPVNTGNMKAVSPSAQKEDEVFSDDNEDEMPEIRIYDKSSEGIFEQASYDNDGVITDFNNLPDEVDVLTNPTLRIHNAQSRKVKHSEIPIHLFRLMLSQKITEPHAISGYIQAHQEANIKNTTQSFACFYLQFNQEKWTEALERWKRVEAMQE
ncbi:ribonuclease H-like domain-containing protein [Tanacetum coccineum]